MTAKEINLAGGQKVYNKEKEDALLAAQKAELVEKIETADATLDNKIDTAVEGLTSKIETADTALDTKIDTAVEGLTSKIETADTALDTKITNLGTSLGEAVNTKNVHATDGIKLDTLTTTAPVTSSAGVGYDESGNLVPIKVVAQLGLPEDAPFIRTDTQGNAKKGTTYDGVAEPGSTSNSLVTEAALAKRGNARTGVHTTTGEINENLIYRAAQYTPHYTKAAFGGIFYEVASFMESDKIPTGAKLIYLYEDTLRFCTTFPPYSGLQFGTDEEVEANRLWFESIEWMSVAGTSGTYNLVAGAQVLPTGNTKDINSVKIGYTNSEGVEVSTTETPTTPAYTYNVEGKVGSLSYDIKFSGTTATVVLTPDEGVTVTNTYVEVSYTTHSVITVLLENFSYTTPVIKVQGAEVATQSVLSFVDYRENATDELLDKRSAETAETVKSNTANIATNTANIATNTANIATNTANIATNTEAITLTKQDILDFKDQVLTIEARKQLPAYINETKTVSLVNNVPSMQIAAVSDNYVLQDVAIRGDQGGISHSYSLYEVGKKRLNEVAVINKYCKSSYLTFVRLYDNGILDIEGVPSSGGTITNISVYDRSTNYTKESYVLDLPAPESLIRNITRCNNKFYCIAVDKNTTTQFTVFKSRATTPKVTWEQVTDTFSSEGGTTPVFCIFKDTVVVAWSEKTSTAGQSKLNAYFVEDNKTYTYTNNSMTNDAVINLSDEYKMLQFMDKDTAVLPVYMSKNDYTIRIVRLSRSKGFTVDTVPDNSKTIDSSSGDTSIKTYTQTSRFTMLCSSVRGYLYSVNPSVGAITQITANSGNITMFYWLEDVGFFADIDSSQIGFIRGSRFTYTSHPPFTNMEEYMVTSEAGFSPNYNLSRFYETPYGLVTSSAVSSGSYALYWLAYDYIKDKLYKTNTVLGLST